MRMSTGQKSQWQKNYTEHTGETGGDTEDGEQVVFGDGEDGDDGQVFFYDAEDGGDGQVVFVDGDDDGQVVWGERKLPLSCTILWPERSRCALR